MTKRVLIVDDEIGITETTSEILTAKGYDVDVANNGSDAMDKVRDNSYDVILLDLVMPEVDGIQVYEEIKRINPDTIVFVLTGYGEDHELVKQIKGLGAIDILSKPFHIDELIQRVESV